MKTIMLIYFFSFPFICQSQFDKYKTSTTPSVPAPPTDVQQQQEVQTITPPQVPQTFVPPPVSQNMPQTSPPQPSSPTTPPEPLSPPRPAPSVSTSPSTPSSTTKDSFGRASSQKPNDKKNAKYVQLNPETAFGPEVVTNFEFSNVTLKDLTDQMQKLTGINLILGEDLKGSITISAPKAITVGEAWKAYLTALNLRGYSLEKSGAFYKIVSARNTRNLSPNIYTGSYNPDTENIIMKIIPLKHISASEVSRGFSQFMKSRAMKEIRQTNTLIVVDTGKNINRLLRLLKLIDVPGHEESLQIIPIQNASAQEIAKLLDDILRNNTRGRPAPRRRRNARQSSNISKIIAEPRTNSIIAMANAQGAEQLKDLIAKLDVASMSKDGGRIHVYYLNHADAEELHKTLTGLTSKAGATSNNTNNNRARRRPNPFSSQSGDSLFSSAVQITADKSNNALVITASPTDYLTIKSVIDKLDIQRDQVYVEGLIMETNLSKSLSFGASVAGIYGKGGAQMAGFQEAGGEGSNLQQLLLSGNPLSLGGFFAGYGIGRSIEITPEGSSKAIRVNSVNGLITALASNPKTNILATPQILALDNTEATFEVGEKIPVPEQNTTATGTTSAIRYEDVTLSLKITPHINKVSRFIKLAIDQNIEDFSTRPPPPEIAGQAVGTTTRTTITTVVVRDRDTIAMGGLMRDSEKITVNKVPLLGDIPLLGWLFKNKTTDVDKTNLLFFLTPKILANYQRDSAENVKDLLNRRNHHLKDIQGEDDPFKTSVKGLYEKSQKQSEGPLYDESETQKYKDSNEGNLPSEEIIEEDSLSYLSPPNYKKILQETRGKLE